MPDWTVIIASDLNDYLIAPLVEALQTAALAEGQADPFLEVMPDVVAGIRAAIQTCSRNRVSATANSVPPDLKMETCVLVIERMCGRLQLPLTTDLRNQVARANDKLKLIAKCELAVGEPLDPLTPPEVQKGGKATLVGGRNKLYTRESLNDL